MLNYNYLLYMIQYRLQITHVNVYMYVYRLVSLIIVSSFLTVVSARLLGLRGCLPLQGSFYFLRFKKIEVSIIFFPFSFFVLLMVLLLRRRRGGNQPCQPRAATLPATLSQITWTPALFKAVTTSIALS